MTALAQPIGSYPRAADASRTAARYADSPVVVIGPAFGELVLDGAAVTAETMAFLVRYTSGFVRVAMSDERSLRLGLPLQLSDATANGERCTVSVDAAEGGTTGISAADRARTVRLLADPATTAAELTRPGHVVPIRVSPEQSPRSPLEWAFATESRIRPGCVLVGAALVSELAPTELAGPAELRRFAVAHGLTAVSAVPVLRRP